MLLDTLARLDEVRDVADVVVQHTPVDAREEFARLGHDLILAPQIGSDLGTRMHRAAADLFDRGYGVVIIVGSDVPTVTSAIVRQAIETLRSHTADGVLGPAVDGGYYLIGINRAESELFLGIEWSTSKVLAQTLATAKRLGLRVQLLSMLRDVDTPADLEALIRDGAPDRLVHLRAWLNG